MLPTNCPCAVKATGRSLLRSSSVWANVGLVADHAYFVSGGIGCNHNQSIKGQTAQQQGSSSVTKTSCLCFCWTVFLWCKYEIVSPDPRESVECSTKYHASDIWCSLRVSIDYIWENRCCQDQCANMQLPWQGRSRVGGRLHKRPSIDNIETVNELVFMPHSSKKHFVSMVTQAECMRTADNSRRNPVMMIRKCDWVQSHKNDQPVNKRSSRKSWPARKLRPEAWQLGQVNWQPMRLKDTSWGQTSEHEEKTDHIINIIL